MAKIDDCYEIIYDKDDAKRWCVKLTEATGDWAGIVYSYGEFQFKEPENKKENPTLHFETTVIYVPERLRNKTFADDREQEVQILLGKILVDIIEKNAEKSKQEDNKLFLELTPDDK